MREPVDLLAALQDSLTRARAARNAQQEIDRLGALAAFWENRTIEATARMHPDLTAARAASEAVTIATLRDENQALTEEVARLRGQLNAARRHRDDAEADAKALRAQLPDPTTHTHDGIRRDHTIPTRVGYSDVGI